METPTVLVVDDDPTIVELVTQALQDEGDQAVSAAGTQAPLVAQQTHPALVLLDIAMPGLNGVEVSRHLRADPRAAQIPVVVMTTHQAIHDWAWRAGR